MLNGLYAGSVCGRVLLGLAMLDQLLGGMRVLAFTETGEVLGVNGSGKAVFLGQLPLPLSENGVALLPVVLFGRRELFSVIGLRLAGTDRF
jgi:hypothetical protein